MGKPRSAAYRRSVSTTEYHLSRRRAPTQDGERGGDGGVRERVPPERDPEPPAQIAAGSQRLDGRVAPPLGTGVTSLPLDADPWSTFDADTADLLLPDLASPPEEPWMPVAAVHFGSQQILVVQRGDEIDLVLPGGKRFTGSRESAFALADALTRVQPTR